MTSRSPHAVTAPWWVAPHAQPRPVGLPALPAPLRFEVRGRPGTDLRRGLLLLAGWTLLWGLFLVAVA